MGQGQRATERVGQEMSTAAPRREKLSEAARDSAMTKWEINRYRTEESADPEQLAIEQAAYRARWPQSSAD
jgi:hypothetical protein